MSRTITAMFDTRADADAARERLLAAQIDADNVRVHDQGSAGTTSSHDADIGIWASIKNAFLPDDDRHVYEEGIRRGGYLLSADVGEQEIDHAVAVLEDANCVDIDERAESWKSDGWDASPMSTGRASKPAMFGESRSSENGSIPIIEEQLVVGKREVERGGMRVRSYVTEMPVHEQVRLRDETVQVERNPVDRDVTENDMDAFRERSIEMTETHEEAVVGKTARVVEEVSLKKSHDEHVEDIAETVRKTDVEIENLAASSDGERSSFHGAHSDQHADADTGLGNSAGKPREQKY